MRESIARDPLLHDPEPLFEPGAEDAVDTIMRFTDVLSARALLTLLHVAGWRLSRTGGSTPNPTEAKAQNAQTGGAS